MAWHVAYIGRGAVNDVGQQHEQFEDVAVDLELDPGEPYRLTGDPVRFAAEMWDLDALAEWLGLQRLWLHALSLELAHPWTGQRLRIEAPPGSEWRRWPGLEG